MHVINAQKSPDMHCETGSRNEAEQRYYFDDPLWDGDLNQLRVCTNNKCFVEDVVLEQIEQ